jgi:hypothetical protein
MPPSPSSTIETLLNQFTTLYNTYLYPLLPSPLQSISNTLTPITTSLLTAASSGDIVSLAAFLLTIYLTIKIADYIRRTIFGWVFFLVKIGIVLLLVQAFIYAQSVGWDRALGDASVVLGWLWGVVEGVVRGDDGGRGGDNRTGFGFGVGQQQRFSGGYGGGRQQVPVGRKGGKSGWTR